MPKKTIDYTSAIDDIDEKIKKNKEIIDTLKKEKSKLRYEQKKAEKSQLLDIITGSGLTAEQLTELVEQIKK